MRRRERLWGLVMNRPWRKAGGVQKPLPPMDDFVSLTPRYVNESMEITSLGKALLFGILAGLLLNAMPLRDAASTDIQGQRPAYGGRLRQGGPQAFQAAQPLLRGGRYDPFQRSCLVLGLADLMWGQLYQNQAVLLVMLLLVF